MITYNSDGIREYNSGVNYGVKIVGSTAIINTSNTTAENIRFTFASGGECTLEMTWYEFNVFNNGTQFTYFGNYGAYVNASAAISNRFGPTIRSQTGTNNGNGIVTVSGNSIIWSSRTFSVSQNIASLYLIVSCSRWDKVTISYNGAIVTTTTTTTTTSVITTTSTTTTGIPMTTTTSTTIFIPPTTTSTSTSTTAFIPGTTTTTTTIYIPPVTTTTTTIYIPPTTTTTTTVPITTTTTTTIFIPPTTTTTTTAVQVFSFTNVLFDSSSSNTICNSLTTTRSSLFWINNPNLTVGAQVWNDGARTINAVTGYYGGGGSNATYYYVVNGFVSSIGTCPVPTTTTTTTTTKLITTTTTTTIPPTTTTTTTCSIRYYELSGCITSVYAYTTIVPSFVGQRFVLPGTTPTFYTYTGASSIQCTPPSGYNSSIQSTLLTGCP